MQALTPVPARVVNLHDHEAEAQRVLDAQAWAYFSGGAADEVTLRANAQAWQSLSLLPRVLAPLQGGHTQVRLLGRLLPHPILLAPVAYQRLAHPDGELATAVAAAAQGAGLVLSTQSSTLMEHVAQAFGRKPPATPQAADAAGSPAPSSTAGDGGPLWFQLYWQPDREVTQQLIERAEAAGFEALVLTVDAPVHGARDRERHAGFVLPAGLRAVNLPAAPASTASPQQDAAGEPASAFDSVLRHAPTWADVRQLIQGTRLPVLLKGILHPDDARAALDTGAAGVIVSNHGGRTLDTAIATAHALPAVAQAVGGQMAVLVDGGLRRGTDIFKALALGADAVLIGKPHVYGLAHAGPMGVAHVIRLLRDELEIAMALCGCATLGQAGSQHVVRVG
jgi:4-hydroxymandelate oxidase